jgi:hypothetical protein
MSENPFVFPQDEWNDHLSKHVRHGGMTLRDYFAGQLICQVYAWETQDPEAAKKSYDMAEHMLAERERREA